MNLFAGNLKRLLRSVSLSKDPQRLLLVFILTASGYLYSQNPALVRMDSVDFFENSVLLKNPYGGGFNFPQFSGMKLDDDSIVDLVVFDRGGEIFLPFLNPGTASGDDFVFAPQYMAGFPPGLNNFVLLRDYNCDGLPDIFTGTDGQGLDVWKNTSTGGNISFVQTYDEVKTTFGLGPVDLFINVSDIPSIDDVDGDGDLDVLSYESGGTRIVWHKNLAAENGNCDTLIFSVADECWGKLLENSGTNVLSLNVSCKGITGGQISNETRHSGSTVTTFDRDGDGDKEALIGDLSYPDLVFVRNAGDSNNALMDTVDYHYPFYDSPVNIDRFPIGFFYDVENDGLEDLLAGPNSGPSSMNYSNSWYYRNVGTANNAMFEMQRSNFIQNGMLDCGMGAFPVIFDANADSLPDLIVADHHHKPDAVNQKVQLRYYENTGIATHPAFSLITRNYADVQNAFSPAKESLVPTFGDMDNDGDADMIVGDKEGKLHYFQNTGGAGNAAVFTTLPVQDYHGIDVGDFSTPVLADMDRDGDEDLLIGEAFGNVDYFENTGTAAVPAFSSSPTFLTFGGVDVQLACCEGYSVPTVFENANGDYELMVGTDKGGLYHYTNVEGNLSGSFTLADTAFGQIWEGLYSSVAVGDLNSDGLQEYVVGNMRGGFVIYDGQVPTVDRGNPIAEAAKVNLFPNPSEGVFSVAVESPGKTLVELKVYSTSGIQIITIPCAGREAKIILSECPSGIYLVNAILNDGNNVWMRAAVVK